MLRNVSRREAIMNRRHLIALAFAAALAGLYGTPAQSEPPVSDLMPADVKWKDSPFPGVQTAVISGDPTQAGLYVVRAKLSPGAKVMPHTHPDTRYDTVLAGEVYFGFGETLRRQQYEALSRRRADYGARKHAAFRLGEEWRGRPAGGGHRSVWNGCIQEMRDTPSGQVAACARSRKSVAPDLTYRERRKR